MNSDFVGSLLCPKDDESSDDESGCHGNRLEQVELDRFAKEKSQCRQWKKSNRQIEDEALRLFLFDHMRDDMPKAFSILQYDGQYRSGLDDNFK